MEQKELFTELEDKITEYINNTEEVILMGTKDPRQRQFIKIHLSSLLIDVTDSFEEIKENLKIKDND